jgi:acetylglutamate/LysW-gamma-L-alpha-aminoadipate kinase
MIVVKIGGAEGLGPDSAIGESLCHDLARIVQDGQKLVLVHGGSHEMNVISQQLGHPARFVQSPSGHSSRHTDRQTLEIYAMVVAGKVNKLLVEQLQGLGVNALGLSGPDGRLLAGRRKSTLRFIEKGRQKVLRDEWSGVIEEVNGDLLRTLLVGGYLPVIAPLAISSQGEMLNVDGDRAAAAVAGELGAQVLVLLSNVPGLLKSFPDEASLIRRIARADLNDHMEFAEGRMKRKMIAAGDALQLGVSQVILGDGRLDYPVSRALQGKGTVIS